MPTAIPALRGKFGKTEYWLTTMRVGELVDKVKIPKELPDWKDLSIDERYQREIDINRVKKEVAPYFASDENRFSSALVLAIINSDNIAFEPVNDFPGGKNLPQLYQSASRDMGFLTLSGEEMLVPIDGQHRAKAFSFAMTGTDNGNPIPGIKSNITLAEDLAPVILMKFDGPGVRRIFSKINQYARATSKGENIITDDDNAVAVLTRELLGEDGLIPARLVRIDANSLTAKAQEFTTLATFHEANLAIVLGLGLEGPGKPQDMSAEQRELATEAVRNIWERLLGRIDYFATALKDTTEQGDATRVKVREETLLGKPIGQLALVRAFMEMRERCAGISEGELCDRLNRIDWDIKAEMWKGVLVAPNGRVLSGKTAVNRAAMFIAHLGGVQLTGKERDELLEGIHGDGWEEYELPQPVV